MKQLNQIEKITELEDKLKALWNELLPENLLAQKVLNEEYDLRLYAIYLVETFHYTSQNAKNQALVATNLQDPTTKNVRYMKFCLKHALDEAGHEQMALHDLKSLGLDITYQSLNAPLEETQDFIDMLYTVCETGNPLARMGYSFWAESCAPYLMPMVNKVKDKFGLTNGQLSFFVEHGELDQDHYEHIKSALNSFCASEQDWQDVEDFMEASLRSSCEVMNSVARAYENLDKPEFESKYDYLSPLKSL